MSAKPQPSPAAVKATAHRAGYTRRVIIEIGADDLYAFIRPSADLDAEFCAIDDESGQVLKIKGWDVNVRDLED